MPTTRMLPMIVLFSSGWVVAAVVFFFWSDSATELRLLKSDWVVLQSDKRLAELRNQIYSNLCDTEHNRVDIDSLNETIKQLEEELDTRGRAKDLKLDSAFVAANSYLSDIQSMGSELPPMTWRGIAVYVVGHATGAGRKRIMEKDEQIRQTKSELEARSHSPEMPPNRGQ